MNTIHRMSLLIYGWMNTIRRMSLLIYVNVQTDRPVNVLVGQGRPVHPTVVLTALIVSAHSFCIKTLVCDIDKVLTQLPVSTYSPPFPTSLGWLCFVDSER